MNLWEYEGKEVIIVTTDDQIFQGVACDYTDPDDNDPEIASIIIGVYEIREDEIKSIEIIE